MCKHPHEQAACRMSDEHIKWAYVWPAWTGLFCSMCGLPFMPKWFVVYLAALAALFSIAAYRAILAGIRSPTTLESHHSAMSESV